MLLAFVTLGLAGVAAPAAHYDPLQTFAPLTLPQPVNRYRSSNGAPGPDYWQNRADYELHAKLDTALKQLSATEVITYTNHSPDTLTSLWIQLDQNTYRADARAATADEDRRKEFTDGLILDDVAIELQGRTTKADYLVSDTRMQIRLAQPLRPAGGKIRVHIRYHYTIPGLFGGRTSWTTTKNGEIYDIAQWYPRMAVYDDLHGWDTLPYLAQEFYLEYGSFDYFVTVPWDMLVAGSGALQNPEVVLTPTQRKRLELARASDATVSIRTAAEIGAADSRPTHAGTSRWHFHMDNTRDVVFSASRAFIWDAARIRLPDNGSSLAMSFYPVESAGEAAWGRSTEYLKHAVEEFSRRWFPYPYPAAVNVAGGSSGMEYPGVLFDGIEDKGKELFWITAHEIGHTWFPMVVGFNERRNAWMDEGFNTFIDVYESDAFSNGAFGPKRDAEYAPGGGNPVDEILPILADPQAPVIMTRADAILEKYRHPVTYFKSALGLILLREQILGPERFGWAFRRFIRDWAFKHPAPADFFRALESEGGEDLSWFWRGWYFNNWTLDLAVKGVAYQDGDPGKGALVTVENLDPLVMPAVMQIDYKDGSRARIALPAETWILKAVATLHINSKQPIVSVSIDPDHVIPDKDRSNNVFLVGGK
ncbi:MAG: Peptidase rane alanine aminopeptidase [Gammaproteobacteria bacterium]|nr:Peptidase rane alanine aminopeptidase [Gammaproteobacteria bacterium]